MKIIESRLRKLEDQLGICDGKPRILLVACKAGWGLALDMDRCVEILDECGSLPTGPVGLVSLLGIPEGLNAGHTERFLRENGAALEAQTAGCRAPNLLLTRTWRRK